MKNIDIDFEVWKRLTNELQDPLDTYNNVIRRLLRLETTTPDVQEAQTGDSRAWTPIQGVSFPAGTEFRATYKRQTCTGKVEGGKLVVNGKKHKSPSGAAMSITKSPVNGWTFWEYCLPGDDAWKPIDARRSMA